MEKESNDYSLQNLYGNVPEDFILDLIVENNGQDVQEMIVKLNKDPGILPAQSLSLVKDNILSTEITEMLAFQTQSKVFLERNIRPKIIQSQQKIGLDEPI